MCAVRELLRLLPQLLHLLFALVVSSSGGLAHTHTAAHTPPTPTTPEQVAAQAWWQQPSGRRTQAQDRPAPG
jgi:hypothetical protein